MTNALSTFPSFAFFQGSRPKIEIRLENLKLEEQDRQVF